MSKELLAKISESLYTDGGENTASFTQDALNTGVSPFDIVDALAAGIAELGDRFERMEMYLPDLMMGGNAMKSAMDILTPEIEKAKDGNDIVTPVKIVLGNLEGDIHDIGRDILSTMLSVAGIDVVNLGHDVKADTFIDKAEESKADLIGLSSLLTTSLPFAKDIISLLDARGLRDKYKVMVGGGAITEEFAESIGADLYGSTAVSAIKVIKTAYPERYSRN